MNNTTAYICNSLNTENAAEAMDVLAFYRSINTLCLELGIQPRSRYFQEDRDAPDPLSGEVVEARIDPILTSALVIIYLGIPSWDLTMDLVAVRRANLSVVVLYEKDARVGELKQGISNIVSEIHFSDYDDALIQLESALRKWAAKF